MVLLRYYLRHLCNKERFAEWPIDEPVPLLQSVLGAWQLELRKAPQSMSRDDALKVLNVEGKDLTANAESDPILRRAYHKLAARYHPDKNPDPAAREVFEQVQKAYELLVSAPRASGGPDEYNISLMLQAQNILYTRCAEALKPFKYSGYPLLLQVRARREIVALSPLQQHALIKARPPPRPPTAAAPGDRNRGQEWRADGVHFLRSERQAARACRDAVACNHRRRASEWE